MRPLVSKATVPVARPLELAPARPAEAPIERRLTPPDPGVPRRRQIYVPLKLRVALTILAGASWVLFSLWLSRHWISELGEDISTPLAILVITGVALIPGYLNIQLLVSILVDRPPPLRLDTPSPRIALLIAAYNEEGSIAE